MSKEGGRFRIRTLLDSGSGSNFISGDVLEKLNFILLGTNEINISGINTTDQNMSQLSLINFFDETCPVKFLKCFTIPRSLPFNIDKNAYAKMILDCKEIPGTSNVLLEETDHGDGIALILGPGAIKDISRSPPKYFGNYIIDDTYFGAAVSGRISGTISVTDAFFINTTVANDLYLIEERNLANQIGLLENLRFLEDKEALGIKDNEIHLDDKECLATFYRELRYDSVQQLYTVALPWRPNKCKLPSNIDLATSRMQQLQRRFMAHPEYGKAYEAKIEELHKHDFVEIVNQDSVQGDTIHYLAHSGVIKEESDTTSLRIVMDGSCRQNASTVSLNDCLYTGPNLLGDMLQCLLGFRTDAFSLTADIEKAFLNLNLRVEDRDALRFFFPENIFDPNSP